MTNIETAERVLALLNEHGYPARWYDSNSRGRSARRDIRFTPYGMMSHHTGSRYTSNKLLFIDGNGRVPGPLSQFTNELDGTIVCGATEYTNNAGLGDNALLGELRDGDVDAVGEISPGADDNFSLNRFVWACETKTAGEFNDRQYASDTALWAAITIAEGWNEDLDKDGLFVPLIGHDESTRRKVDPVHPMAKKRAEVAALVLEWTGAKAPAQPLSVTLRFPLPRGWYFGPESGPVRSVSGRYRYRDDLRDLQRKLIFRGFLASGQADGLYGPKTRAAIIKAQKFHKIAADGLAGRVTWDRLFTKEVSL